MRHTISASIQKGQSVPDFTLNDLHGNPVSSRSHYMRRNLVIAFPARNPDPRWSQWVHQLFETASEIPDGDAAVLLVTENRKISDNNAAGVTVLLDEGGTLRSRFGVEEDEGQLVIADRYGVIFHVATGQPEAKEVDPAGVPGWVEFVVCRCS